MTTDIILCSASPRRKELLEKRGVKFNIYVSDADESIEKGTSPKDAVMLISKRKALAVFKELKAEDKIYIAADTVVALGDRIFGKPKDEGDAYNQLKALSGKAHSVFTGVTVIKNTAVDTFAVESKVYFKNLSDGDIYSYIATKEPMDKAGSYAIQGIGSTLVERFEGDYENIVGLPTDEVLKRIN